jgi:hypothetical protein
VDEVTIWRAIRPTIALLVVVSLAWACSGNESCGGAGVHAIVCDVREADSGAPVCDAYIHVTAPDYDRTFQCQVDGGLGAGACCTVYVLGDPNKEYAIEVTATGFSSAAKQVFVPGGDCGQPVTQHVTVEMQPL